jgi:glutathione S-transferase
MPLVVHGHPFSSYCQKVTVAFYETSTPFEWKRIEDAAGFENLRKMWPIGLMPVVSDGATNLIESSIIIEKVAPKLVSSLEVRFMDRFFDNYVMTPMQKIVGDFLRPEAERDPRGVADAKTRLTASYGYLNERLKGRSWAAGDSFTMADCAAAPSLFYADWVHPIAPELTETRAYRARLLARPSFARAVEEARPFRHFFPPGAPDRD